ncbi:type IV secretory system conjugative DNA transfer family protein [Dyella nitratireducens]|uniref:Type IV secretion system protein VirD4 n=1 Tax=Dyella nitratireducens TaxID=1849580 RepID=A0ABQ1FQ22_9GAMM|nr:type IV secretory system conjugative DNA transfer family protein [Dyella nitratireducens]GGA26042.1 hypothetical protein GCM10010981_13360 [Dyella nitratireducens]GLQ43600.1 hypothetical protein GCM10007902_34500 [Dyella nitratireducens]
MSKGKLLFACIVLWAAMAAGWVLSNYLVLLFLGLHDVPQAWNMWWQYFQALDLREFAPFATRIKLSGAIGFGVPFLAWLALMIALLRPKPESLHGDASFADLSDLKRAGLLKQNPESILIGKYKGHYLWLSGTQHVIVISPTRAGKTATVAIPVLLTYKHSVVVIDWKGELEQATSGWRESQGQLIWRWAPYDAAGNTLRFNPMTLLAEVDAKARYAEIQSIAAILYPDGHSVDPFWNFQSRAAFTAFTNYMFEAWDQAGQEDPNTSSIFPSFERILRFSSGADGKSIKETLQTILTNPQYAFVGKETRSGFSSLVNHAEQTFSSVIATMQAPLQQFLSPILADATNATDFDITAIRKWPTTLYVNIPTNKLDESSKLLNIFFSSVINNNLTKQLGEEPDLKYQMLMLMDEFTAMGRLEVWSKRISISASYGVRDVCIVQSRAQLRSIYGDNDGQNFITNHSAQIAAAAREQSDANEYSDMLGYKTIRKRHRSTGHGGGTSQASTHYTEERRALMLPQEIKELPKDDQLIFYEGCKPIRAKKNWYFEDKMLMKRASMPRAVIKPVGQRAAKEEPAKDIVRPQNERAAAWLQ